MILHFGLHLDGLQPARPETAAGKATVGPARLLDLLELRLGLPPVLTRPGQALLAYQSCLAELDEPKRFYHRSFRADPLAVARTLLAWRAVWHEHGWPGVFNGPVSRRLEDMAAAETLARERVPLTHGQRLHRVLNALDRGLDPRLDRIVLHCERAELPLAWQAVLARFPVEAAPGASPEPQADPHTDLGRAQRALLELASGPGDASAAGDRPQREGAHGARRALARDDSLIIVRAISRDLSAQAIAEHLRQTAHARPNVVVIAERDGVIIDNAFERVGLPRAGFQHYSRFRAVTQVLKLCLGLVWEPIDAHLLLQFLIHPVGPLPDYARSTLAQAVAEQPGVGGTAWHAAIDKIAERTRTKLGRSEAEIGALVAEIRYWLESERYASGDGAPIDTLIERARRCTAWLAGKLHASDEEDQAAVLFAAAEAQGEALIAALTDLRARGASAIGRIALERLVDEVGGHAPDPTTFAQAGHVSAATEPAAITQTWQTVIWWDLAARLPSAGYPWSDAELAELAREGVALPPVEQRIRARIRTWLRPILNARSRLILVIHDRDEGHHPLYSQLRSQFENFNETRVEDALLANPAQPTIPALDVPTEPLPRKPLQRPRRWWQLPPDCGIGARAQESYSSLNKLINHPHEWVLTHAARLYPSRTADLPHDNLLCGNLAHRLLERFFNTFEHWSRLDEATLQSWLADFLPVLVRQEGALLSEPGRGVLRERVLATLETAFTRLLGHLRAAGIESAAAEQPGEAEFMDTTLCGTLDLLLRDARGREIVLDVKWGGQPFRGAELAQNRHLQLATYAYLRRSARGDWPYQAYYIVSTGNVLARDTSVFPNAVVFPPAPGTSQDTAALWARVGAAYEWRRAQLAAGRIEVTAAGTEPTAESAPPLHALDTAVDADRFDNFTWLTGWEEGV